MSEFFISTRERNEPLIDSGERRERGFWDQPFEGLGDDAKAGLFIGYEGLADLGTYAGRAVSMADEFVRAGGDASRVPSIDQPRDNWWERMLTERRDEAAEVRRQLTVDPATRSESANMIGDLTRAFSTFTTAGLVGGNIVGAGAAGFGYGGVATEQLRKEGLSEEEAERGGLIEGGFMGVMGLAPVSLPGKLWQRAASGAGMNLAFGAAQRGSMNAYLNAIGHEDVAEQYSWYDPESAVVDAALGACWD